MYFLHLSYFTMIRFCLCFFLITYACICSAQSYSDSISVNLFLLDECMICQKSSTYINEVLDTAKLASFQTKAYFPNFSSKPDHIEAYLEKHNIDVQWKTDYYKGKAKDWDVKVLPTIVIIDEKNDSILYHGKINNQFESIGKQRRHVTEHYALDALQAIKTNTNIPISKTEAVGCFINFKEF